MSSGGEHDSDTGEALPPNTEPPVHDEGEDDDDDGDHEMIAGEDHDNSHADIEDDEERENEEVESPTKEDHPAAASVGTPGAASIATDAAATTASTKDAGTPNTSVASTSPGTGTPGSRKQHGGKRKGPVHPSRKGRAPAVRGLTIPFRTTKKAMKLDPDIPIVQNEAAIMTTLATELFLKDLVQESFKIAKSRGRSTIKYEDVAEARTKDPALNFLEKLLP